ncbi:MAG: outer membrane lipoprotein LolB [Gammaproteobacteria bacterium]|nr:outer membrane lipoprotein LolB [Gammaproteobacteria bacterium]
MINALKNIALLSGLLLLAACAPLPLTNPHFATPTRSPKQLENWTVKGTIIINTEEDSSHARFNWHQQGQNYTIDFFGPLGTYHQHIEGSPHSVSLIDPQNHLTQAPTPEALLQQTLGWRLPVRALIYWIRGLPTPAAGWQVEYGDYTVVEGYKLPQTLTLTYPELQVKIRINRWEINA